MVRARPAPFTEDVLLYVEDDKASALLFKLTLEKLSPTTKLFIVESAQQALDFLERQSPFEQAPRPRLVILDLNLPDGTGLNILETIRSNEQLAELPAVLFTTSTASDHRRRATELGASGFFLKPPGLTEFEQAVGTIHGLVP